jgi:D-aminoacyl-tRNA deacylase
MVGARYLIVISETDPVAPLVAERWGTPPSIGTAVDGAAVRRLSPSALVVRRPGAHIDDEHLDLRLPPALREPALPLVFPSVHRSEQNLPCFTVHPLGNPGAAAEVGGAPRSLVPTAPRLMVAALRAMNDRASGAGLHATYEATHHGPLLGSPAFFVEIGFGELAGPPKEAVAVLADILPALEPAEEDRVALAVGGGHYAPHFTDLALRRSWAFGHILSRHSLATIDPETARAAFRLTPSAEGAVFARVGDASLPALAGIGPRLKDSGAPERAVAGGRITDAARRASGT